MCRIDCWISNQTRPDQSKIDQTRPNQTILDQTIIDQTIIDQTIVDHSIADQSILDKISINYNFFAKVCGESIVGFFSNHTRPNKSIPDHNRPE